MRLRRADADGERLPPLPEPSIDVSASLTWGAERYRYPTNLPKVAATGGPQCMDLPNVRSTQVRSRSGRRHRRQPGGVREPAMLLNFDGLKQLLYGPIDGPPRNTAQIGQPG